MQASKKKKKTFWKDKNKWEKNKGGIRWCPLQLQTFRLTMVERWSFIILSWLSPSHTKNATSDLPILWLCCVDGPWVINLCRKVLSHCLPVQLPPSGRWLGAQKVTAHEKKKKTQTSGTNQFLQNWVFTWIFQLPKNRQELFYYSTAGIWSIWETSFLKMLSYFFFYALSQSLWVWLCVCVRVHVSV